jgi:hypothetical protein
MIERGKSENSGSGRNPEQGASRSLFLGGSGIPPLGGHIESGSPVPGGEHIKRIQASNEQGTPAGQQPEGGEPVIPAQQPEGGVISTILANNTIRRV